MGISNTTMTASRIESARAESKLAVYKTDKPGMFNSFFADTLGDPEFKQPEKKDFVGLFYGTKGAEEFKAKAWS
jgi:hypothetical protein